MADEAPTTDMREQADTTTEHPLLPLVARGVAFSIDGRRRTGVSVTTSDGAAARSLREPRRRAARRSLPFRDARHLKHREA